MFLLSSAVHSDGDQDPWKTCPFCAKEIQDAAKVCKHCGRDLVNQDTAQKVRIVQPEKTGLSALAWLLIAVVALVVIGAIGNGIDPSEPASLTVGQRAAVTNAFTKDGRVPPDAIDV